MKICLFVCFEEFCLGWFVVPSGFGGFLVGFLFVFALLGFFYILADYLQKKAKSLRECHSLFNVSAPKNPPNHS